MPKESLLIRQLTAMGLYYYSIGLPSVKTILWHYRQATGHTAVKNLLFKLKSVLTTCLLTGMAWLAWFTGRTERPDGWSVGRSFSTGPLLSLSSLEALHSVPKCHSIYHTYRKYYKFSRPQHWNARHLH